jgi:hypothetical protein
MPALVVKIPVTQGDLEYIARYVTAELIYRWSLNTTCEQEAVNEVMDFIGLDAADLTAAIASNKNFIKIVGAVVENGGRRACDDPLSHFDFGHILEVLNDSVPELARLTSWYECARADIYSALKEDDSHRAALDEAVKFLTANGYSVIKNEN